MGSTIHSFLILVGYSNTNNLKCFMFVVKVKNIFSVFFFVFDSLHRIDFRNMEIISYDTLVSPTVDEASQSSCVIRELSDNEVVYQRDVEGDNNKGNVPNMSMTR